MSGKRIYLMSLATQVVVRCSILCSKFTKNPGPVGGAYSSPPNPITELRGQLCSAEWRERKEGKEGNGDPPEQKSWLCPAVDSTYGFTAQNFYTQGQIHDLGRSEPTPGLGDGSPPVGSRSRQPQKRIPYEVPGS